MNINKSEVNLFKLLLRFVIVLIPTGMGIVHAANLENSIICYGLYKNTDTVIGDRVIKSSFQIISRQKETPIVAWSIDDRLLRELSHQGGYWHDKNAFMPLNLPDKPEKPVIGKEEIVSTNNLPDLLSGTYSPYGMQVGYEAIINRAHPDGKFLQLFLGKREVIDNVCQVSYTDSTSHTKQVIYYPAGKQSQYAEFADAYEKKERIVFREVGECYVYNPDAHELPPSLRGITEFKWNTIKDVSDKVVTSWFINGQTEDSFSNQKEKPSLNDLVYNKDTQLLGFSRQDFHPFDSMEGFVVSYRININRSTPDNSIVFTIHTKDGQPHNSSTNSACQMSTEIKNVPSRVVYYPNFARFSDHVREYKETPK